MKKIQALFLLLVFLLSQGTFAFAEETSPEKEVQETTEEVLAEPLLHPAYFFADENGLYHADALLTRLDLARMVYSLLGQPNVGKKSYSDIPSSFAYAQAVKVMQKQKLIQSEEFLPDRTVTIGELLQVLNQLYPDAKAENLQEPLLERRDEEITRAETAHVVNQFAGRNPDLAAIDRCFSILPDMVKTEENYYDFAEAVLGHTAQGSGEERWLDHEEYPVWEAGFIMFGGKLHYVGADGTFVRSASEGSFMFDENGAYTSGKKALDEQICSIIQSLELDKLSPLKQLETVYEYVIRHAMVQNGPDYEMGENGWWNAEEAYALLTTGYGSSYGYAAAFCELARALGFPAETVSGKVVSTHGGMKSHGWVELKLDGENYLFDPEMQDAKMAECFRIKAGSYEYTRWAYSKTEEDFPEMYR